MSGPNFQRIKELYVRGLGYEIEIMPHKVYSLPKLPPNAKSITHIGVYNGRFNYYNSAYPSDYKGVSKGSKWFHKIPNGKTNFTFRNCKGNFGNPGGFTPGKPTFPSLPVTPHIF